MQRLTIEQAAHALGLSISTVRRRVQAGSLPAEQEATPQGHRWLVLVAADEPISEPQTPPPAAAPADLIAERDWLRQRVEELTMLLNREQEAVLRLTATQPGSQRLLDGWSAGSQSSSQVDSPMETPAEVPDRPAGVDKLLKDAGVGKRQRRKLLERLSSLLGLGR